MYTQQDISQGRQKFWISFGRYISPIPSSEGEKVNWINYRTGIKSVFFKMNAGTTDAGIGIEITHPDEESRSLHFNHFKTFKKAFEEVMNEKWEWHPTATTESGNEIARIFTKLEGVNILNENDWPAMIAFLKTRIILLDKFWNEYKEIFEMLT